MAEINRLLFPFLLRCAWYLHQFWTYKELLYTKLTQMLWGFCRAWPFYDSFSSTRDTDWKASPLFYWTPLTYSHNLFHILNLQNRMANWLGSQIHTVLIKNCIKMITRSFSILKRLDFCFWLCIHNHDLCTTLGSTTIGFIKFSLLLTVVPLYCSCAIKQQERFKSSLQKSPALLFLAEQSKAGFFWRELSNTRAWLQRQDSM